MDIKLRQKAFNSKVLRAYDVRGLYPEELDHNTVELIARGFGAYIQKRGGDKNFLLGEDSRESSREIMETAREALLRYGFNVIEIGLATTPLFLFSMNQSGADGGIMVTASHNSVRFNGMKLYKGILSLNWNSGLKEIGDLISRGLRDLPAKRGSLRKADFKKEFVDFILSLVSLERKPRVVFDAGGGGTGVLLPDVISRLGLSSRNVFFKPDPTLSCREPNPILPSAQVKAREELIESKAEAGFIFDPDGDRVVVLDEKGRALSGDEVLWLLSENYAETGDKVVYDLRSSSALAEDLERRGVLGERTRVGRSFIEETMRREKAVLGGELSGHFYFKDFFHSNSAILAALKIIEVISRSETSLSEMTKPFRRYFNSGEINFKIPADKNILEIVEEKYLDGGRDYLDGLTVRYPNWWFNLRKSNTEDLLRLVLEARDESIFKEKKEGILSLLSEAGAASLGALDQSQFLSDLLHRSG